MALGNAARSTRIFCKMNHTRTAIGETAAAILEKILGGLRRGCQPCRAVVPAADRTPDESAAAGDEEVHGSARSVGGSQRVIAIFNGKGMTQVIATSRTISQFGARSDTIADAASACAIMRLMLCLTRIAKAHAIIGKQKAAARDMSWTTPIDATALMSNNTKSAASPSNRRRTSRNTANPMTAQPPSAQSHADH